MTPNVTILDAIQDVFAGSFKDRTTWSAWFAFLKALFALPMSESDLALYRQYTGRKEPPPHPVNESWLCVGRRGGKSFTLALIATFLACFHDYREHLNRGERGTVMVVAQDRKAARIIMRFIRAFLELPMLARMVERETAEGFDLLNQITIEVHTASFRSTRGYTIVACLADEIAYWATDDDAAEPDFEVLNAIRPGMGTIPNAMLLCSSSPHARKGALFDAWRKHYGKDGDPILVWQAETRQMNPTYRQAIIDEAMEADPAKASAEYLAQFRSDIEGFVNREVVEACIVGGLYERPPQPNVSYVGFVDPAGGSGQDSFTLAVAHRDSEQVVLDCVREVRPLFSPEAVVTEFAAILKSYNRISKITGDRFAGLWPVEVFAKHGIRYEQSAKPKSDIYVNFLPLLNSKKVELLDHARLFNQLVSLERKPNKIDHPPNQHDDICNAAAGALLAAHSADRQRIRVLVGPPAGYPGPPAVEIDLRTGRPIKPEPTRIRVVRLTEQEAPAVRGTVHSKLGY